MGLALAAPLLLMAITSLKSQSGVFLSQGWTLAQFGEVLGRASYRSLFLRSVLISGAVTLVTVAPSQTRPRTSVAKRGPV